MFVLVTGGAASGKSAIAENIACRLGQNKAYIATMRVCGQEDARRVDRHRALREGKGFETIEYPVDLDKAVISGRDTALLECMTNLAANEMFRPSAGERSPEEAVLAGIRRLTESTEHLVVVTGDVFSDGVHYSGGTEEYIRLLAAVNRACVSRADVVLEAVCGIPVYLKGEELLRFDYA